MRLTVLTLLLSVGSACCPMPWPRQQVVVRELTLTVVDRKGVPVPDAEVLLAILTDPHEIPHELRATRTDAEGRVHFDREERWETVMPLMMHGVPFYKRWVCAHTDDGWMVQSRSYDVEGEVTLQLDQLGDCSRWRERAAPWEDA